MTNLIENILNKKFDEAKELFESRINDIAAVKLIEAKKHTSAKMSVEGTAFIGMPGSNTEKLKRGINEDELEEMSGNSGLVIQKTNKSKKSDLPSNVKIQDRTPEDKEVDDLINRNTKGILRQKERGMLPPNHPVTTKMEEESEEQLDEARIKILKARVRGGKVQRRKKISNVEGFKMTDGQLKRMSPAERRRRKLGQKRGKLKRRSKMRMSMMKRKRSLRKRASIGL